MADLMAVQVTMYLTEGDSWHHRPLHLEVLNYLREENVAGAVVFHAVAGFLGRNKVHTAHLVEAGGDLPVVVTFVDTDQQNVSVTNGQTNPLDISMQIATAAQQVDVNSSGVGSIHARSLHGGHYTFLKFVAQTRNARRILIQLLAREFRGAS